MYALGPFFLTYLYTKQIECKDQNVNFCIEKKLLSFALLDIFVLNVLVGAAVTDLPSQIRDVSLMSRLLCDLQLFY